MNGYCLAATLALAADYGDACSSTASRWRTRPRSPTCAAGHARESRSPSAWPPPSSPYETEKEAQGYYGHLAELAAKDTQIRAAQKANIDDKVVMLKTTAKSPSLGTIAARRPVSWAVAIRWLSAYTPSTVPASNASCCNSSRCFRNCARNLPAYRQDHPLRGPRGAVIAR
ncbi:hypothetical protein [Azorhizobium caulinodans]|uniref:hypothetical protein n=1 Tax=Azorhizobium caulinodans TaxID=7 RepID=UPI0011D0AE9C|nr:hypothetical protein [Azorhizobium caulinodans]